MAAKKSRKKASNKNKILNLFNKFKELVYNHKTISSNVLVLLIGIFFSLWLLKGGIINGHDMTFHLSRIKGIRDSLAVGDFRALIHVGLYGYGYANGMFYGNLLLYIPALFSLAGLNLINSYKVYLLFCTVASAFTMYYCTKIITKSRKAGILGSFLYSACSYKMCDFIIRAAAGEIGAFIFLPLIILGFYQLVYGDYKKWYIFSIGFVGLVQCHLISTVLMAIIIVILIVFNYQAFLKDKKRILYLIISGLVGLLIGAYFILPLLQGISKNKMIVNLNSFPIWKMTVPFEKLFLGIPYYESTPFIPGGIGILYIILVCFRFKIKKNSNDKLLNFCDLSIITAFATLICATDFFPWKEFTFLQSVQFPWRLYLFSSFFFTIASAIVVFYYLKGKTRQEKCRFIIPVILVALVPYFVTENYYRAHSNGGIFYNWDAYTVASGEYLPVGTDLEKLEKRGEVITSNNDEIETTFSRKGNSLTITYNNKNKQDDTYIEVPLLYYYGYTAESTDGIQYKIKKGKNNIIRVYIPNEKGTIKVYYKGTTVQKLSSVLSILSWIVLIGYIFIENKGISRCKNGKKKKN